VGKRIRPPKEKAKSAGDTDDNKLELNGGGAGAKENSDDSHGRVAGGATVMPGKGPMVEHGETGGEKEASHLRHSP